MLFDFLSMAGNYEDRKVDRYEEGVVMVDTCLVTDSEQPYETAVSHPKFNGGDLIIVELYDTKEQAQIGHDRWVKTMTVDTLPESIKDVSTAEIAKLGVSRCGDDFLGEYERQP